ncbi:MAG: hypothetical protein HC853_09100, partial [Anaerolineae bacterium]|nr:hypothetical protein [Anaerolineae bacterium]
MRKQATTRAPLTATFEDHLRLALKHLHQPAWLGEHSPLAAPYFLLSLQRKPTSAEWITRAKRGEALHTALVEIAQSLWGSSVPHDSDQALAAHHADTTEAERERYHALILDLNYVHAFAPAA